MTEWYNTFDAVFFTGIATMVVGLCGLAIKYGFASKCDNVQLCCGLLKIHRSVNLEVDVVDDENNDEVKENNV